MAQAIKNVKAGQKFLVIDKSGVGFEEGCIVESLDTIDTIDNLKQDDWINNMKYIGGYNSKYKEAILAQKIKHLKRFKGKIKWEEI